MEDTITEDTITEDTTTITSLSEAACIEMSMDAFCSKLFAGLAQTSEPVSVVTSKPMSRTML